jgi:SAM-dependent methyltransferase
MKAVLKKVIRKVAQGNGSLDIRYAVDAVNGVLLDKVGNVVDADDQYLKITGWVLNAVAGDPLERVDVGICGKYYRATYGRLREDVGEVFGGASFSQVGFSVALPLDKVCGEAHISLRVTTKAGKTKTLRNIVSFAVAELPGAITRKTVSKMYLRGNGIEIGGLDKPLMVYEGATVQYVDRMTKADLLDQYVELRGVDLVETDIVDSGETLEKVANNSQDFIVANHFFEHCQNPLETFQNFARVLRKDGIVYMAIPNKEITFDKGRAVTTLEHIIKDFTDGPEQSRLEHFRDFTRATQEYKNEAEYEAKVQELLDMDYSIHFHVWDEKAMLEFFLYAKEKFGFSIEFFMKINDEFLCVLKKQ